MLSILSRARPLAFAVALRASVPAAQSRSSGCTRLRIRVPLRRAISTDTNKSIPAEFPPFLEDILHRIDQVKEAVLKAPFESQLELLAQIRLLRADVKKAFEEPKIEVAELQLKVAKLAFKVAKLELQVTEEASHTASLQKKVDKLELQVTEQASNTASLQKEVGKLKLAREDAKIADKLHDIFVYLRDWQLTNVVLKQKALVNAGSSDAVASPAILDKFSTSSAGVDVLNSLDLTTTTEFLSDWVDQDQKQELEAQQRAAIAIIAAAKFELSFIIMLRDRVLHEGNTTHFIKKADMQNDKEMKKALHKLCEQLDADITSAHEAWEDKDVLLAGIKQIIHKL